MYIVTAVCVCLSICLSLTAFLHYCTDPDLTWGNGRGCPLVLHYWVDLKPVHGFHCSTYRHMRNVSECLCSLMCLVIIITQHLARYMSVIEGEFQVQLSSDLVVYTTKAYFVTYRTNLNNDKGNTLSLCGLRSE